MNKSIQQIHDIEATYQSYCNWDANSREAIQAFHKWYRSALVLIKRHISPDNDDLKFINDVDLSGNGYTLNRIYRKISPKIDYLLDVVGNGGIRESNQSSDSKPICVTFPKVFISHSSNDKALIQSFVDNVLVLGLGLNNKDIAFTSQEVYGIEPGEDIITFIRETISSAGVVLLMISSGYKKSEVCLNEMGAAWALEKNCISIILPDADFTQLGWLTSFKKAIRINDKEQMYSLCQRIAKDISIDLGEHFTSLSTYLDKFLSFVEGFDRTAKLVVSQSPEAQTKLDEVIISAINKLGEFTIKKLQIETGIQNNPYLEKRIKGMVLSGSLEVFGSIDNLHYRNKSHLSIKL